MSYDYDLIIIGGGSAGLVSAKLAAGFGRKVVIIEHKKLGGDCTWTGCIPSKTLIKSASISNNYKIASKFGLKYEIPSFLDAREVMVHIRAIRDQVYHTHTPEMLKKYDIDVAFGSPQFVDNHTVLVNGKKITSKSFIIATGSSPFIPQLKGLDDVDYYTNETIFEIDTLPKSCIILGAGPIGIELGSALNRLGIDITIVEINSTILPHEDPELSKLLQEHLKNEGVKIRTGVKAESVYKSGSDIVLSCIDQKKKHQDFTGAALLIATGRIPNIAHLGLENLRIKLHKKGIVTNKYLETSQKNIYACGDAVGPYLFSHMAEYQAIIATRNALLPWPLKKSINPHQKIWVTFSDPEFATAGLSENEARKKYGEIFTYQHGVKELDRAKTDSAEVGTAKFICDKHGYLVGATILAPRAGELIHEVYPLILDKKKFKTLFNVVHAYPTYSEIIWHAAKKAEIDSVERNFFVKLYRKIFQRKAA